MHPCLQPPPAATACTPSSCHAPPLPAVLLAVRSLGAALSTSFLRCLLTSPCVSHHNDMQHLCVLARCMPQMHGHGVRVSIQVVSGASLCFFLSFSVTDLAFFFFFSLRRHRHQRYTMDQGQSFLFFFLSFFFSFVSIDWSFISVFFFSVFFFCFMFYFYFLLFTFYFLLFTFYFLLFTFYFLLFTFFSFLFKFFF